MINKRVLFLRGLLAAVFGMGIFVQLFIGPANLSLHEIMQGFCHPGSPTGKILWQLRIPRILYGILTGASLASCGLALQGLFQNPLAEPFTLGISSGAGFGAVLALVMGIESGIMVSLFAFLGAIGVTVLVFVLAQRTIFSQTALILSGVMVGYLFQSALMLLIAISPSNRAHGAMMWLLGDLGSAPIAMLPTTAGFCLIGYFFLFRKSGSLDLLSLGEEKAASLGIRVSRLRAAIFIGTSLAASACVAAVGIVGFVGLIIPQAFRKIVGPKHAILFPLCLAGGASFILFCDFMARTVLPPIELPLGVITGIIGSLFFLWIFIQKGA